MNIRSILGTIRISPFYTLLISLMITLSICDGYSQGSNSSGALQTYHFDLRIYMQGEFDESRRPPCIVIKADLSNKWLIDAEAWEEEISPGVLVKDEYTEESLRNNLVNISLMLAMQYISMKDLELNMTYITSFEEKISVDSVTFGDKFDPESTLGYFEAFMTHSMIFNEEEGNVNVEVYSHTLVQDQQTFTVDRKSELIGKHELPSWALLSISNYNFYSQIW